MTKLIDVFVDWELNGFFATLYKYVYEIPFRNDIIASLLDMQYFGTHSGDKPTSPLIDKLLGDNTELSLKNKQTLVNTYWGLYGKQITKLWDTMTVNYDMLKTYVVTKTEKGTDGTTDVLQANDKTESTVSSKDESNSLGTDTNTATANVYGYNADTPTPSDTTTASNTNSEVQKSENSTTAENSNERSVTGSKTRTVDLETSTDGNIFTSQQKLIEQERKVWEYDFCEQLFKFADYVLTSPFYERS